MVANLVDEEWKEIYVEAEIDDDLADLSVWFFDVNGDEKYFEISSGLIDLFVDLRKTTGDRDKGLWSKCL